MNQSDEESLKRDYCAGVMTLREIGQKYGITEGAVRKKARTKKWVRKQVRKTGTQNEECVPKKRTSKNAGKTSSDAA
ncbi:terminase small subunit, partial [Salmonella enterica]|nr:terminase small subunit [Salmonella enterica]